MIDKKYSFNYINSFDGLRGIAAFFVLLLHGSYGFFQGGWIGVDLFFVLSGFLITSLLIAEYLKTKTISFSKFYVRRFLRLFPPLIACIVIANILWSNTVLYPGANQKLATAGGLFYFTNLLQGNISGNLSHLWSLSVEEHFYIFFPLLALLFIFKLSHKNRITFLILMFFIVATLRIIVYNFQEFFVFQKFTIDSNRFTFCKIDGIILGVILSFLSLNGKLLNNFFSSRTKNTTLLLLLFIIFIIILFTLSENNKYWRNGGFILTDSLCFFTVITAIKNPKHFLLSNKVVTWLGKRSYGLYVYHFPIFLICENFRESHSTKNFLLVTIIRFCLSIGLAGLSYEYLEQPILKLKKRFEVSRVLNNDV